MGITQGTLCKAPFAIAEIKFPHANELLAIAELFDLCNIGKKLLAPLSQGRGVVGTNIIQLE
jgi:hypothetical protein